MTAACTCPPDDCHGGHTLDFGPSWVNVPEDRLRRILDNRIAQADEIAAMAAELLALRARVAELDRFIADLARGGLRFDLNPTVNFGVSVEQMYGQMTDYLHRADASIRDRAAALIVPAEASQRELIGYAVVTTYLDGRWVQTAPVVSLDAARARARVHAEHDARVVELREVTE